MFCSKNLITFENTYLLCCWFHCADIVYEKNSVTVLIKTWNDLKRPATTYSNLKRPTTSKKRPETTCNDVQQSETTYNEQETTWNDPQRVRHNLQRDTKQPTTNRFWDCFTVWGNLFSSLTRLPANIWLQSFEHCFMENHSENRAPNICILSCVFFTAYKIYRIRCEPLWHSQIWICDAKVNLMN